MSKVKNLKEKIIKLSIQKFKENSKKLSDMIQELGIKELEYEFSMFSIKYKVTFKHCIVEFFKFDVEFEEYELVAKFPIKYAIDEDMPSLKFTNYTITIDGINVPLKSQLVKLVEEEIKEVEEKLYEIGKFIEEEILPYWKIVEKLPH